jgi:hypothetical protein
VSQLCPRKVSQNEIIRVWLRREFEDVWSKVEARLPKTTNYSKTSIKTLVDNPNYRSPKENNLRLALLWTTRHPLLLPVLDATWQERTLNEHDFQNLKVIKEIGWNVLSNFTGNLLDVATRVADERGIWCMNQYVGGAVDRIHSMLNSRNLNTDLILLESDDSETTTILEGNKTAVSLCINIFVRQQLQFNSFRVFVGHHRTKSIWEW